MEFYMDEENEVEQPMIDFKCPYCGEMVSFIEANKGLPQDCPFCTEVFIVPQESGGAGARISIPISTQRLVLRRLCLGDLDGLIRLMGDEELARFDRWYPMAEEQIERWLEGQGQAPFTQGQNLLVLAIESADDQRLVGFLTFQYLDATLRQAQIAVVIDRQEQRKGFGIETIRGLLDFGFRGMGLRRMTASCDSRNEAFLGLAAKAGFRQEGAFFEDRCMYGEWVNTAYFAMLEDEFKNLGAAV